MRHCYLYIWRTPASAPLLSLHIPSSHVPVRPPLPPPPSHQIQCKGKAKREAPSVTASPSSKPTAKSRRRRGEKRKLLCSRDDDDDDLRRGDDEPPPRPPRPRRRPRSVPRLRGGGPARVSAPRPRSFSLPDPVDREVVSDQLSRLALWVQIRRGIHHRRPHQDRRSVPSPPWFKLDASGNFCVCG